MKSVLSILLTFITFLGCERREPQSEKPQMPQKQVASQTGNDLLAEAKQKLSQAKEKLIEEGRYGCCVKEPCNYCALHEASCDCYKDLQAGEHVCIECYSEWQRGNGAVEGVRKEAVKTDFVKHEHAGH